MDSSSSADGIPPAPESVVERTKTITLIAVRFLVNLQTAQTTVRQQLPDPPHRHEHEQNDTCAWSPAAQHN